jgi:hypothetical protein
LRILGRLRAADAVQVAREWVAEVAARRTDFCGAHLMGGITELAPDDLFDAESDIDIGILVSTAPQPGHETADEPYRGLIMEAGFRHVSQYDSPEKVLSNPEIANHIAVNAVLADPLGIIGAIQPAVARDFAEHRWVVARCDDEKHRVDIALAALHAAKSSPEFLIHLMFALQGMTALLAVSMLRNPTHRRCLVRFRAQLHEVGRPELADEALNVLGVADMPRPAVSHFFDRNASAFDRAVAVHQTPALFDFKIRAYLRPYTIDSIRPMVEGEDYREAMWWIGGGIVVAVGVLMNDAPATERPQYETLLGDLFSEMGLADPSGFPERIRRAEELRREVFALADELIAVPA